MRACARLTRRSGAKDRTAGTHVDAQCTGEDPFVVE